MIATMNKLIFGTGGALDSYCVAAFSLPPGSHISLPDGESVSSFVATGYGLPALKWDEQAEMEIEGDWENHSKYGWQFKLSSFREILPTDKDALICYLCRTINGVGKVTAHAIYRTFGAETADVLDNHPERLTEVKGISRRKARDISEQVFASQQSREVISILAPYRISVRVCNMIVKKLGANAIDVIKTDPYVLMDFDGFSFSLCDRLAAAHKVSPLLPSRLQAALLATLKDAEIAEGHLCLPYPEWLRKTHQMLNTTSFSESQSICINMDSLHLAATELRQKELVLSSTKTASDVPPIVYVYRYETIKAEVSSMRKIKQLTFSTCNQGDDAQLRKFIRAAELQSNTQLSDEQRDAVLTCLNNNFSIITGGPGTGKSTILKIVLNVFCMMNPEATVTLCAPTGKAARRMEETTGYFAATIHRTLGIRESDDEVTPLDTDFIIVDESSMMDVFVSSKLFAAISEKTKVLFVGDVNQLPSIGPGAVLSELIGSGCIPCVKLTKVFRQAGTSRIAINAGLIREGITELEYGDDFVFIESNDLSQSADIIVNEYVKELGLGTSIDDIVILSPRREEVATSAMSLAERIREQINPREKSKPEVTRNNRVYRLFDMVMQQKNTETVSNGDVGIIVSIDKGEDSRAPIITVDYGNSKMVEYTVEDLDYLRLAYACTIHKSQGAEYRVVIMSIQNAYHSMLQRNLVYTGITRAKKKIIIVGDKSALIKSINRVTSCQRNTLLAYRLHHSNNSNIERKNNNGN